MVCASPPAYAANVLLPVNCHAMNPTQHKEELNIVVFAWNCVLLRGILGTVQASKCRFAVVHLKLTSLAINHRKLVYF